MRRIEDLISILKLDGATPHLVEAFTHRSFAVEHDLDYDNQRLEFLGDAVLEIVQTEYLFHLYPDAREGELTKLRSSMACEKSLADIARSMGLGNFLRVGRGEVEASGGSRESTLADLFEAMLGALYLDMGFDWTRQFLLDILEKNIPDPRKRLNSINPKGQLQEFSQSRWGDTPRYRILHTSGPQHCPEYMVEATLRRFVSTGRGSSRKEAECMAAQRLLEYLSRRYNS